MTTPGFKDMDVEAYDHLADRKAAIQKKIIEISGVPLPLQSTVDPPRADYHWDIMLKEVVCVYNV